MSGFDSLYLFCAVNYFAQGMAGIVYEPVNYLLKDGLKLSAGQAAVFVAWMTAPFVIKPLFGLLTDLVRLPGGLRRPHLVLGALLVAGVFRLTNAFPSSKWARSSLVVFAVAGFGGAGVGIVPDSVHRRSGN